MLSAQKPEPDSLVPKPAPPDSLVPKPPPLPAGHGGLVKGTAVSRGLHTDHVCPILWGTGGRAHLNPGR